MIDPIKISNFNLNNTELEENILFWICAAGKNGVTAARCLNNLLTKLHTVFRRTDLTPFQLISKMERGPLQEYMREAGIGNHSAKSKGFKELADSKINLKTCCVDELEAIHSIGPKTSRAFLVHTRPNQRYAVIDTHILKFLRHQGHDDVPLATPTGKKYQKFEQIFLDICDKHKLDSATLDLAIWNHYRIKANVATPFDIATCKP